MTGTPARSYTGLAIATVEAALIIGSVAYLTISPTSKTTTKIVTVFGTTTVTSTIISTVISTLASSNGARVYAVTFQQVRDCGQYNIMPWAVTIDGLTAVQPSNQSLPLPTNYFSTIVPNQNLTRITFYLPSGVYNYALSGGAPMGGELYTGSGMTSGTVEVSGADVSVNVEVWLSITCTATTSTP